jgi:polar amino acid transport system permease protein
MLFQVELSLIALAIENIAWTFSLIIVFVIGTYIMRWYVRKKDKHLEEVWDTSLKTAVTVNLIWLIINIPLNILLNLLFAENVFIILFITIIDILIGTTVVMKVYKKIFRESFLVIAVVQLILFAINLILLFIMYLIFLPPYIFIFILVTGLPQTLVVTAIGLFWGFILGVTLAIMRVYGGIELGWLASGYEKLFRGIPLLVLIYLFTFGIPFLSALEGVVLALALRSGAYQSQIFRGAFLSVNPGQMDAAYTLGMNRLQAFRYVLMPQAFRLAIPSWSNEYSVVIKDSSFAFEVGIIEMTRAAYYISVSFRELWALSMGVVAVTYLLFTYPITKLFGERQTNKLKKLGIGGG